MGRPDAFKWGEAEGGGVIVLKDMNVAAVVDFRRKAWLGASGRRVLAGEVRHGSTLCEVGQCRGR